MFLKVMRRKQPCKIRQFFTASIKSMNPMQKYPHIIELFACTWKMLALMFLFPIIFFNFFRNMLNTKNIKINNFISSTKYSNPMCVYFCIFIKFYYISPILYFFRLIVSRINTIKLRFILIIALYFKVC